MPIDTGALRPPSEISPAQSSLFYALDSGVFSECKSLSVMLFLISYRQKLPRKANYRKGTSRGVLNKKQWLKNCTARRRVSRTYDALSSLNGHIIDSHSIRD